MFAFAAAGCPSDSIQPSQVQRRQSTDDPLRLQRDCNHLPDQPKDVLRIVLAVRIIHDPGALIRGDLVLVITHSNASVFILGCRYPTGTNEGVYNSILIWCPLRKSLSKPSSKNAAGTLASSFGSTLCRPPPYTRPSEMNCSGGMDCSRSKI